MEVTKETDDFKFVCPERLVEAREGRAYRNIEKITYYSKTTGTDRHANVVLPMNYSDEKKYPVIYALHGLFGHEGTMLYDEDCKIPVILGNMYEDGLAKEVIVVFPNIYSTGDVNMAPGFTIESLVPYDNFINELIDDLNPYIEANYPILGGPENRALFGFSMGAREAIYISFKRADLFPYVVAIAPAPGLIYAKDWAMEHPGIYKREEFKPDESNAPIKIFMMCKGSRDSVVGRFPIEYHEALEENGVEHIWYDAPEVEHGERIVQSALFNFMRMWK